MSFEKKWNNWNNRIDEIEKFQKKMRAGHSAMKKRLIGGGGQKNVGPYKFKPSFTRALSAPPGFGAIGEDMEKEIFDSFKSQSTLEPKMFKDESMDPVVREKLLKIAYDFLDSVDLKIKLKDILLTGSLASYNWSDYSDIDLHILVDFEKIDTDQDLVKSLTKALSSNWNLKHDIEIHGYDVEMNFEDSNNPAKTVGVYSVLNDKWKEEPTKDPGKYDVKNVEKKAESVVEMIDQVEDAMDEGDFLEAYEMGQRVKKKVRKMRQSGLEQVGVFSIQNLAFKALRRAKQIERLDNLVQTAYDEALSLEV